MIKRSSKPRRGPARDKQYLDWIREQPCAICEQRPVEAAHVGLRGMGQKCSDYEAIPLCPDCHRIGEHSHHVLGKYFWSHYGIDRDILMLYYREKYGEEAWN